MRRLWGIAAIPLLTTTLVPAAGAAASADSRAPRNGRIAYSVGAILPDPDLSAHSNVFTVRPDGTGRRQLTHLKAPKQAGDPNYSPDASHIAYVSNATGRFQVWLMRRDGTHKHRLVADRGHDAFLPRWAPDGKHLVFTRCTKPFGFLECTIARVRADGSHLRNLTGGHWIEFDARYAPDGHTIAFTSSRDGLISAIWVMRADGSHKHRLTAARPEAFWPDFTPDGRTILFVNNFGRPNSNIFTMRADGTRVRPVTQVKPPRQAGFGSYSPDGRRIVFDATPRSNVGTREGLAVMRADGTHRAVIVRTGNLTIADWGVAR